MTTWREMSRELAGRLEHAAALCGDGCDHDPQLSHKTAAECPFCADHAAYVHWLHKESIEKGRRARRAGIRAGVAGA